MDDQRCGNCRFFKKAPDEWDEPGWCRRLPPVVVPDVHGDASSIVTELPSTFPDVGERDWCGEWKENGDGLQRED